MGTFPALSVLLPTFQAERHVAEALRSVLTQTHRDLEVVVVDDGSTDGTLAVLRSFAAGDARVRVITGPHRGLTPTLNIGLGLCRARHVARMDADDVCEPDRFLRQLAFLQENSEVVCLGTRVTVTDGEGHPVDTSDQPLGHAAIDAALLQGVGWTIVHPTAVYDVDVVKRLGGYREQFPVSQDLDLWLRLAEVGMLANLPAPLLRFRVHPTSVGATRNDEQWRAKPLIVGEAYDRRGLPRPATWAFPRRRRSLTSRTSPDD